MNAAAARASCLRWSPRTPSPRPSSWLPPCPKTRSSLSAFRAEATKTCIPWPSTAASSCKVGFSTMTSSNQRLAATFEHLGSAGRTALIPYIAAGDPSLASTPALMHALVGAGADVIELGVPFSDPMADGPVIQRAAERAIARGAGLRQVFDMVRAFRQKDTQTPVVLMGYANPIEHMGQAAFASEAAQAGVDGVLVVDYPPEETV